MTETKRQPLGWWATMFAVAVALCFWPFVTFLIKGQANPDDIRRPCALRDGVQQVVTTDYASINGVVTVVCKDGTVHKVL